MGVNRRQPHPRAALPPDMRTYGQAGTPPAHPEPVEGRERAGPPTVFPAQAGIQGGGQGADKCATLSLNMTPHIDYDDTKYAESAAEILRRHDSGEAEANITSAVRDFLTLTKLVKSEEIKEEKAPALGSRQAVDLTALDTFIEIKKRIGNGLNPNPEHVQQLDDYLEQSNKQGRVRMGVLTDGKYWLLRWPGAGTVKTTPPHGFTLEDPKHWIPLYEWLRNRALYAHENVIPSPDTLAERFGPNSPSYERDIDTLRKLYDEYSSFGTIRVKRQLWENLLMAALGEIAHTPEQMDDLFVRHTYLTSVVGIVVQASFGIDILRLAETDPADLLLGRDFRSKTGLQGIVDSDFFAWPAEVGGLSLLKTLARDVSRFDWQKAPTNIAAILYETVIPAEERRQLGEYYTPAWLAETMVRELVTDPLNQNVLDPACGSGAFIAEAVSHFVQAAQRAGLQPKEVLDKLRFSVAGIDVHPVAVHLARTAWVMAARPAIAAAKDWSSATSLTAPIYLGDALQLRFRTEDEDMFAQNYVTVQVGDEQNTELVFPKRLVQQSERFDALMGDIAEAIEHHADPHVALDDHGIRDPEERRTLEDTVQALRQLHHDGRDHIWAYYTRNLVRPVALSESKVDVIIGNPPWINYNQTVSILRTELVRQSRTVYGIWAGGQYATHQDVASLFFARSVALYLKDDGIIGMVMPHSALQAGQHSRWRKGQWTDLSGLHTLSVDFSYKTPWDLEQLNPNTFFPIPASVVFAKRLGVASMGIPLVGEVERWQGKPGRPDVQRVPVPISEASKGASPYAEHSRQGATIVPRRLFFVEEAENTATIQAGGTVTVNPRLSSQDKVPWKDLDLTAITGQTVEASHIYNVHLGETLAPYVTLDPLKAVLPLRRGEYEIPRDKNGVGGIRMGGLEWRMRDRWQTVSRLWEDNKSKANKLNLLGQLDYYGKLSAQLEWQKNPDGRPVRVVYSTAGQPTAALLGARLSVVTERLYWVTCKSIDEAFYLIAIINSDALYRAANPLMSKGLWGARDLHKHLWRLPIPAFDAKNALHRDVAKAGRAVTVGATLGLAMLREERGDVGVAVVRGVLRTWLRSSKQGKAVENAVGKLLAG